MSTCFPLPVDEAARLTTLGEYRLLGTPEDEGFDRLARLAAQLFNVPIVLISLMGSERQYFKAHYGTAARDTAREASLCTYTILQDDVLLVPDAAEDARFHDHPLVTGPPYARFYAGQPLVAPNGAKVGTVCLIDREPHAEFSDSDRERLSDIAALVMERMEGHRRRQLPDIRRGHFDSVATTSPDAIVCSGPDGRVSFWNAGAERLFGYTAAEVEGRPVIDLVPETTMPLYLAEMARLRAGQDISLTDQTVELVGRRKDGTEFPAEFSFSSWRENGYVSAGAIIRDISERKENEQHLFRLASLDALTGLPNRAAWRQELTTMTDAGHPAMVALVDLDGFKDVNDTLGHAAGDVVLTEVAERLRHACRDTATVARLGGDEFVALSTGNDPDAARRWGHALVEAVAGVYEFGGHRLELGASVGLSLHPQHGDSTEQLLGAADLALYRAKESGRERHELFDTTLREKAVAQRAFKRELRHAFHEGQFELYYQPQFSTSTGALVGAEALIRWHHPERGLLTPGAFIEALEEKPSAPAIGEWILRTACEQAVRWRERVPHLRVAVNLFDVQLKTDKIVRTVASILDETGLPPEALELELVETILTRDDSATVAILEEIRSLGVGLAFDDYGTGYASLSLLKRYPVSRLKIDRTFVRDVHRDTENAAVVTAVLYLARTFGLDVTAEGVETVDELKYLRERDVPEFQGFLLSEPVPAERFTAEFVDE